MTASVFGAGTGRSGGGGREGRGGRQSFIGIDVSKQTVRPAPRGLYSLFALGMLLALGVAALRIDLIRTRYAVSAVLEREADLMEQHRQLTARRRQLRDPVELAVQARERGFRPPAHVVSVPDPSIGSQGPAAAPRPLPTPSVIAAVAAGPAEAGGDVGSEWQ